MNREELRTLCGSIEQVASVRPVEFLDGRAAGLRCALVRSGALETALMLDKCLDPAWLTYRGINLGIMTKPGLQGRGASDTAGAEAVRSIMGGAMMTCGLGHIHGYSRLDGKEYPTHGRIRTTPAEKVGMDADFLPDGTYRITVRGEMREATLFGENLRLRRRVETDYGRAELTFIDQIENQGFEREPLCLLYHCNAGYPLLTPESRVIIPSLSCLPRDAWADETRWREMEQPSAGAPEQVFLHRCGARDDGGTFAAVVNDALKLALCIRWNVNVLPHLAQWKSTACGDYAMALEPTNAGFGGRAEVQRSLDPMERLDTTLRMSVLEGAAAIAALEQECDILLERR